MLYFCKDTAHKAYPRYTQFRAHWNFGHKGETLPGDDDPEYYIDESMLPEGIEVAPQPGDQPWAPKAQREEVSEDEEGEDAVEEEDVVSRRVPGEETEEVEDTLNTRKLDLTLDGIGVGVNERKSICKGWQTFAIIRAHPTNLHNYLRSRLVPKFHSLIPMVVNEMFSNVQDGTTEEIPLYGMAEASSGPYFDIGRGGGYRSPYGPFYGLGYERPIYYPPGGARESTKPSPELIALQQRLEEAMTALNAVLEDREKEKAEQAAKVEKAALDQRFTSIQADIKELTKLITSARVETATEVASKEGSAIQARLEGLAKALDDEKERNRQETIKTLQTSIERLSGEITALRNKPTEGKTVEDLASELGPLVLEKVDNIGSGVKEELKGIREDVSRGIEKGGIALAPPKLPSLSTASPSTAVEKAEAIAKAVSLEESAIAAINAKTGTK